MPEYVLIKLSEFLMQPLFSFNQVQLIPIYLSRKPAIHIIYGSNVATVSVTVEKLSLSSLRTHLK